MRTHLSRNSRKKTGKNGERSMKTVQKESGTLEEGQRWSVGRKREVVLRLLSGESMELVSREIGVEVYEIEWWRERAMKRIGEQAMTNELLRQKIEILEKNRDPSKGRRRWKT